MINVIQTGHARTNRTDGECAWDFSSFKDVKKSTNMARAERLAEQQEEGMEPLMLILIEEVRQLRRDLAAYQDEQRSDRR